MANMTASERYAARKKRTAVDLRHRTIAAADRGSRHARLRTKYGPDWRRMLDAVHSTQLRQWDEIVERNLTRGTNFERNYLSSPWRGVV